MSDEISLEGKQYISSKRASELSGYAQDYIGQLARASMIDAKRVGGLWYVSLDSLNAYKTKADAYKPAPPKHQQPGSGLEALISFDGKQYVSAARAAKTTGYHQDYVGQLARSGKILSRQIGNRWYVDHEALAAHKDEKDALLGAVQALSVGIAPSRGNVGEVTPSAPFFTYTKDVKDLLPTIGPRFEGEQSAAIYPYKAENDAGRHQIPIRVIEHQKESVPSRSKLGLIGPFAAVLTIIVVLALGFVSLKSNSLYVANKTLSNISELALSGSAADSLRGLVEWVERLIAPEITYTRPNK